MSNSTQIKSGALLCQLFCRITRTLNKLTLAHFHHCIEQSLDTFLLGSGLSVSISSDYVAWPL